MEVEATPILPEVTEVPVVNDQQQQKVNEDDQNKENNNTLNFVIVEKIIDGKL